jgi:transposase
MTEGGGAWAAIKPMLPNKPRGVPQVSDRRLDGIVWVLRSGAPWRDLPNAFGPYTGCCNRLVRWRRAGARSCVHALVQSWLISVGAAEPLTSGHLRKRRGQPLLCLPKGD